MPRLPRGWVESDSAESGQSDGGGQVASDLSIDMSRNGIEHRSTRGADGASQDGVDRHTQHEPGRHRRDDRIAGIVANWPKGATAARAHGLGLAPEVPHVIQACADPMIIPVAALRAEGVADTTLKAIEAGKK